MLSHGAATVHIEKGRRQHVFDRVYVSNPACMPNRSTIMTGRMPSAHGVIFNDRSLSPGANSFVRELRANGNSTALIGKSHLQHGMSPDAFIPFPGEPGLTDPWPVGWNAIETLSATRGRSWTIPMTSTDSDRSSSPSATATRSGTPLPVGSRTWRHS
jgi:arylsulfatase A-like enzyme